MFKKIVSVISAICLCLSFIIPAYAEESDYYSMSDVELAEMIGSNVEEINQAKNVYGKSEFNDVFGYYLENTRPSSNVLARLEEGSVVLADAETGESRILQTTDNVVPFISNDHWDFISEKFKAGQILITHDDATPIIDHGHSAILISSTRTVEHLGSSTTKYSGEYDVDWWQGFSTMKSFNYSDSSTMSAAATYAKNNLTGWEYNALASRYSSNKVNCATLVWKAYNSQNVNVVNTTSGTVIPKDFDKSSKLNWVRSVGWNNVNW